MGGLRSAWLKYWGRRGTVPSEAKGSGERIGLPVCYDADCHVTCRGCCRVLGIKWFATAGRDLNGCIL